MNDRYSDEVSDVQGLRRADHAWGHEIKVVLAERPNNGRLHAEVAGLYLSFPAIDYFGTQTNNCGWRELLGYTTIRYTKWGKKHFYILVSFVFSFDWRPCRALNVSGNALRKCGC
jgi:hypothetical protein